MKKVTIECPVCGNPDMESPYPNTVCHNCVRQAVNANGRPPHHDSWNDEGDNPLFINGIKCWVRYKFGGRIVMRDEHDCPDLQQFYERHHRRNAFRGALLGLAVGDALGTTVEFRPRGSFPLHSTITGGGPFGLNPGEWTDDTSMALCLADSLVTTGQFDAKDQMERFVKWYREGYLSSTGKCFDIGNTTLQALKKFELTGDPFSGPTDPHSAENGSLMRLAPIPLLFADDHHRAIELSGESSRTTHGARTAIDACRYFGGLLVGAQTDSKEELLLKFYCPGKFKEIHDYWERFPLCPEIAAIAAGSFKTKREDEIKGSGYVVESLEAALWAFHTTDNFRDGLIKAVNLGDDADTTGAIYGQLAGVYYGEFGIPRSWRLALAKRELIENLADALETKRPGKHRHDPENWNSDENEKTH